jgi:hypothetical protein
VESVGGPALVAKLRRAESYRNFTNLTLSSCETFTNVCEVRPIVMKPILLAAVFTILGTGTSFAERLPAPDMKIIPAKLQPASGLDMSSGLGTKTTIRTGADSSDAWRARFPKQPNGRSRE